MDKVVESKFIIWLRGFYDTSRESLSRFSTPIETIVDTNANGGGSASRVVLLVVNKSGRFAPAFVFTCRRVNYDVFDQTEVLLVFNRRWLQSLRFPVLVADRPLVRRPSQT